MAQQPPYVPNSPLTVAANLRYTDGNGDIVSRLYPNDYVELIGGNVSTIKAEIQQIDSILVQYNTRITTLETTVAAIQSSGVTFMLYVNGGCLNGNTSTRIDTQVTSLTASECAYITALGTTTALASAVGALGIAALNTLPAYSQNSVMSGLAGWETTLTTTAGLLNNLALAYLDIRVGVTQALSQSNITCADVILNYQGVYNMSARTISFYFYGSSIPANFSASGGSSGTFTITDTAGHTYTQTFNLYTIVNTGYITVDISASGLLQNSQYAVILNYSLTSTTPSLGCSGGRLGTVVNNTSTCPNFTSTALGATILQFTFVPTIISNVAYTVDLLNSSGTTSGSTVLDTKVYNNPVGSTTDTFINLSPSTLYFMRISVTTDTSTTICPIISQSTP